MPKGKILRSVRRPWRELRIRGALEPFAPETGKGPSAADSSAHARMHDRWASALHLHLGRWTAHPTYSPHADFMTIDCAE
jgi:hypothetical protein